MRRERAGWRSEFDPLLFGTYAGTRTIYYDETGRMVYI